MVASGHRITRYVAQGLGLKGDGVLENGKKKPGRLVWRWGGHYATANKLGSIRYLDRTYVGNLCTTVHQAKTEGEMLEDMKQAIDATLKQLTIFPRG